MSLVAFEAGKPLFDARCSGTTATSIVLSNERTSAVLLLHSSTADLLQVWHAIVVFSSGFLWPMWVIRVQSWDRVLECLGFALDTWNTQADPLRGSKISISSSTRRYSPAGWPVDGQRADQAEFLWSSFHTFQTQKQICETLHRSLAGTISPSCQKNGSASNKTGHRLGTSGMPLHSMAP